MPDITRLFYRLRPTGLALIMLVMASTTWAKTTLLDHYQQLKNGEGVTLPGTGIHLSSTEQDDLLSAEVNSIIYTPFETVSATLAQANNWCQVLPLHFNIKACTYEAHEGADVLTVYSGRKIYEHPDDSYKMMYQFEIIQQDDSKFLLRLHADHGPMSTSNYQIVLEALRVDEGTLLHIHSSYQPSWLSTMLTSTYLSTIGRNKVGFSYVEQDGEQQLVQGIKGIIERNVMRYQIAINAFLNAQAVPEASRYEATLTNWFAQNDAYPQLHEMDEAEYLAIKREERQNQQQLQKALDTQLKLAAIP